MDVFKPVYEKPFFNEFVLKTTGDLSAAKLNERLLKSGIIGGLELSQYYPELYNSILLCVTETKTRENIDTLVAEISKNKV
ncbi:MAG TPA: hypothetical protein VJ440_04130 [Candidatus Brocadiaceae bacterium]|nr:hypothetical protein [Candidatus Brocadiaceae bacterium]